MPLVVDDFPMDFDDKSLKSLILGWDFNSNALSVYAVRTQKLLLFSFTTVITDNDFKNGEMQNLRVPNLRFLPLSVISPRAGRPQGGRVDSSHYSLLTL
jgi:hypothetical protein